MRKLLAVVNSRYERQFIIFTNIFKNDNTAQKGG